MLKPSHAALSTLHPEAVELSSNETDSSLAQVVNVPRSDRWRVYHRLQELRIPCACPADGSLRVEVNHGLAVILVRSTVQQFCAPRQELVDWLDRCWQVRCQEPEFKTQ